MTQEKTGGSLSSMRSSQIFVMHVEELAMITEVASSSQKKMGIGLAMDLSCELEGLGG